MIVAATAADAAGGKGSSFGRLGAADAQPTWLPVWSMDVPKAEVDVVERMVDVDGKVLSAVSA